MKDGSPVSIFLTMIPSPTLMEHWKRIAVENISWLVAIFLQILRLWLLVRWDSNMRCSRKLRGQCLLRITDIVHLTFTTTSVGISLRTTPSDLLLKTLIFIRYRVTNMQSVVKILGFHNHIVCVGISEVPCF